MNKELSFDDKYGVGSIGVEDEGDALVDSKLPINRIAKIIDEFEVDEDDMDVVEEMEEVEEEEFSIDSLRIR
jgi:hypothetical protein